MISTKAAQIRPGLSSIVFPFTFASGDRFEKYSPRIETLPRLAIIAEECFLKAIEVAQKQQAKSLELRATASLTRLWQQQESE
jgi:hypothetical protein